MSHKVVTLVYSVQVGSAVRKAVLAYMADCASDDGSGVWASKKTIADELECGRSTVIRVCKEFVDEGILTVTGERKCTNGATVEYALNLRVIRQLEPIKKERKTSQSGTSPERDRSQSGTPPVPERDPKTSQSGTQTVLEPSLNHLPPKSPSPESMLCEVVRPETARDFIAHRKAMKKPVTPEAAKRLVAKLRGHPDPDSVFDLSIENGWQGVFPEKVKPTPRAKETGSERADRIAAIYASEVDNGSSGDPVVPLLPARQSG